MLVFVQAVRALALAGPALHVGGSSHMHDTCMVQTINHCAFAVGHNSKVGTCNLRGDEFNVV